MGQFGEPAGRLGELCAIKPHELADVGQRMAEVMRDRLLRRNSKYTN
jgi:hypothetical protein